MGVVMEKQEQYQQFLKIARNVIDPQDHPLSSYANTCALLQEHFGWHWVGFYFVDEVKERLYLGPFQGPLACTNIPFDKGVCGKCYREGQTQVVDDVNAIADHIACSSLTQSEIVVPLKDTEGKVRAVLDIDSVDLGSFDGVDASALEELVSYFTFED